MDTSMGTGEQSTSEETKRRGNWCLFLNKFIKKKKKTFEDFTNKKLMEKISIPRKQIIISLGVHTLRAK